MSTYTHDAVIDHPRSTVTGWYGSPGAIRRLTPEFSGIVLQEPTDGLDRGSVTKLLMGLPWAETFLPGSLHAGVRWTAVHTEHTPGETFTDVMDRGPLRSWTHHHVFSDAPGSVRDGNGAGSDGAGSAGDGAASATRVHDEVDYELPARLDMRIGFSTREMRRQLDRVFEYRTRQTRADLGFHAALRGTRPEPMTVVIAGASGLVGTQLSALLRSGGHRVITLQRREGPSERLGEDLISWDPSHGILDPGLLAGVDAVVNLSGAGIAGRFTDAHRKAVLHSRLDATRTLVTAMAQAAGDGGPMTLVSASASGYYGHDAGPVTESSPSGADFLAEVCRRWEAEARRAEDSGIRVALVRTGLVLSAAGGLLGAQLPLYLSGAGGPMGGGDMWQPWISLHDLVQIYAVALADPEISGPLNAAAPHPVTQREFARTLGRVLRRPAIVPTPAAAPAAVLGRQGARELALADVAMDPAALREAGYRFRFEDLEDALRLTLGRFA